MTSQFSTNVSELLMAQKNQPTLDEILSGWYDVEKMTAHAQAISQLRTLFESCIATGQDGWCSSGFETWCSPIRCCFRTKGGILMKVLFRNGEIRDIHQLYTPFGGVRVINQRDETTVKVAQRFIGRLAEIVELIDVTSTVGRHCMNLYEDDKSIRCSWDKAPQSVSENGNEFKIYLLRFPIREDFLFANTVNVQPGDLFVLRTVNGADYEIDKAIFNQVTNGRGSF